VVEMAQWSLISVNGIHCSTKDGWEVKNKSSVLDPLVGKLTGCEKLQSVNVLEASSLILRAYLCETTDPFSQSMSGKLKSPKQHTISSGCLSTISAMNLHKLVLYSMLYQHEVVY